MAKIIAITSGKGGVGKTTFCVNLGYELSKQGKKVLLIDGDICLNNLDVVLGIENKIVYDLIDIIEGKCRVRQALIENFECKNLYILPSNHTYCFFEITDFHFKKIINEIRDEFDFILIDCPAGIDSSFTRIVLNCDSAIVVTTPHLSAVRDADKTINEIKNLNIEEIFLVLNRVRGDLILDGEMMGVDVIKDYLKVDLIGVVPESDYANTQLLIGGFDNFSNDFKYSFNLVAKNIVNYTFDIFDCTKKYKGMFGSIRKNLRKIV